MAFIPLADRLLVKADPVPDEYIGEGGKKLTAIHDENAKLPIGTVLAKGNSVGDDLKPGTRIIFEKYCGEPVPLYRKDGSLIQDLIVIKLEDVKGYDDGKGDEALPGA